MSTPVIVYVLTGLAAVVVVLTRVRLRLAGEAAGRFQLGGGLLATHTVSGALALLAWVTFLVAPEDSAPGSAAVGIVALAFWWIVVVAGLLILVRWLPSGGKHASEVSQDSWSEGPGLSILAHVGMLAGVCVFTWAYLTAAV
ncbi:hypothetical protein [Nocardioides sp.]|uniref:hypothetical protein n=1 Tax=Nocardioides sp. TaxID=35761 RepID=UPI0035657D1F